MPARNTRLFLIIASILGLTAVLAGTFGAHGLEDKLDAHMLDVYHTGAQYHMYHALALIGSAIACAYSRSKAATASGWLFTIGVLIFSGSLYALAITGFKKLGMVAPIGGTSLMIGWVCLFVAALKIKVSPSTESE